MAVTNGIKTPSRDTLPAGATWPFVTLSIGDKLAEFKMSRIHKRATPLNTEVRLSRWGYLYFYTKGSVGFGFLTPQLASVIKELKEKGFSLDDSCLRNLRTAKLSIFVMIIIPLAVLALVLTMSILKPNGI